MSQRGRHPPDYGPRLKWHETLERGAIELVVLSLRNVRDIGVVRRPEFAPRVHGIKQAASPLAQKQLRKTPALDADLHAGAGQTQFVQEAREQFAPRQFQRFRLTDKSRAGLRVSERLQSCGERIQCVAFAVALFQPVLRGAELRVLSQRLAKPLDRLFQVRPTQVEFAQAQAGFREVRLHRERAAQESDGFLESVQTSEHDSDLVMRPGGLRIGMQSLEKALQS